jgi:hypothetical protein
MLAAMISGAQASLSSSGKCRTLLQFSCPEKSAAK